MAARPLDPLEIILWDRAAVVAPHHDASPQVSHHHHHHHHHHYPHHDASPQCLERLADAGEMEMEGQLVNRWQATLTSRISEELHIQDWGWRKTEGNWCPEVAPAQRPRRRSLETDRFVSILNMFESINIDHSLQKEMFTFPRFADGPRGRTKEKFRGMGNVSVGGG